MTWRSRSQEHREAQGLIAEGYGQMAEAQTRYDQGIGMVESGYAMEPGKQEWGAYLLKPFKLSEYNSEQIVKGTLYMITGGLIVVAGLKMGELHQLVQCCESVGFAVGGGLTALGFIHAVTGFK